MRTYMFLNRLARKHKPQHTMPAVQSKPIDPFTFVQTIEYGTVLYTCAIDSLATIIKRDRDMHTFEFTPEQYVEFKKYEAAHRKEIQKEFMVRYHS